MDDQTTDVDHVILRYVEDQHEISLETWYKYVEVGVLHFKNSKETRHFIGFHKLWSHPAIVSAHKFNEYLVSNEKMTFRPGSLYLYRCEDEPHPKLGDYALIDPRTYS